MVPSMTAQSPKLGQRLLDLEAGELAALFVHGSATHIAAGLPPDAKVVAVGVNGARLGIILESAQWPPLDVDDPNYLPRFVASVEFLDRVTLRRPKAGSPGEFEDLEAFAKKQGTPEPPRVRLVESSNLGALRPAAPKCPACGRSRD